jgi:hypothetical protein
MVGSSSRFDRSLLGSRFQFRLKMPFLSSWRKWDSVKAKREKQQEQKFLRMMRQQQTRPEK